MGYLVLRSAFGYDPLEAMAAIRQHRGTWTPHLNYIRSIERAIETMPAKDGSSAVLLPNFQTTPLTESRVVAAYRQTPTPQQPARSAESGMRQEDLAENLVPFPSAFGTHASLMKTALNVGGSEMGLGLTLQSLVASIRAERVVEIGRHHGFSALALASGLALVDAGWKEPLAARQRPDVDYGYLLAKDKKRQLYSIDPFPAPEAKALIDRAGLQKYVTYLDQRSDDVDPGKLGPIDALLIDGDHAEAQVRKDIIRYVPHVRPGGYFVLHDAFGWYDGLGNNGSPIEKAVRAELDGFERLLVDTGFASFYVFRKNVDLSPQPERAPARKDGRPTVGLVLNAIGDEAQTVIARAIVKAWNMVDAVTVVIDGAPMTADVCKHLGADVYFRKTPEVDWKRGIGFIAGARNDALAIAEKRTDYVMILRPRRHHRRRASAGPRLRRLRVPRPGSVAPVSADPDVQERARLPLHRRSPRATRVRGHHRPHHDRHLQPHRRRQLPGP